MASHIPCTLKQQTDEQLRTLLKGLWAVKLHDVYKWVFPDSKAMAMLIDTYYDWIDKLSRDGLLSEAHRFIRVDY